MEIIWNKEEWQELEWVNEHGENPKPRLRKFPVIHWVDYTPFNYDLRSYYRKFPKNIDSKTPHEAYLEGFRNGQ